MIRDEAMDEIRRLAALLPPPASAVPIYENMIELYAVRAELRRDDPDGRWDEPEF